MSRQVVDSLKRIRNWVFAAPSPVIKIATGEGIAGTRAAPMQSGNNDTSIGGRLDHGETYEKGENQDSHRVWAQADLEIGAIPDKEAVEKLFDDIQSGLERP
ncbi:hypothetical protein ACO22_05253 [Paracoccidioides brasiliensis]|uniref:Uncharacterized protein n=1 Tax=Paracoccidioides brasiliensis TaxID=121759 RepID=A0A1D2JAV7_PARBR|nr:hypothetical protein ACO22_05253 [Paracoccidioides brasiliensis]